MEGFYIMKKILLTAVVALVLVFAMLGAVSADGGPHGNYTPTTDACAGCHRAHTAAAPRLLVTDLASLCLSCHGNAASGADTNVEGGVYLERDGFTEPSAEGIVDRGLRGGGFVDTRMSTDLATTGVFSATSMHTFDGTAGTVWGNGDLGTGPGLAAFNLECTDCHDPHGNGNYRILRPIPTDSGALLGVNVTDEISRTYTIGSAVGQYFGEGYTNFGNSGFSSREPMHDQYLELSDWCERCHTRYMAGTDAGITDSTDPIFAYRHSIAESNSGGTCSKCHTPPGPGPVFITFNDGQWRHDVECMTCHVAHGSSADMTTDGPYSGNVPWPGGVAGPNGDARSSLLRVDGRGTCQGCHNK
jgi:predicted CXXCH cytochrome family protein